MNLSLPFGAIVGSIIGFFGLLMNMSRRKSFIITDFTAIISIVGSLISFYIHDEKLFILTRVITGIVIGFNTAFIPVYIYEMSPHALLEKTEMHNL